MKTSKSFQNNKEKSIARLFNLGSSQPENVAPQNTGPPSSRQPISAQSTQFTDCKEVLLGVVDPPQETVSTLSRNREINEKYFDVADKRGRPNWRRNRSATIKEEALGRSSAHSTNVGGPQGLAVPGSSRSQDSVGDISAKKKIDTFSFTSSNGFQLSHARNTQVEAEMPLHDASFVDENHELQPSRGVSMMELELEEQVKEPAGKMPSSKTMAICILSLSLLVALYFALFGSSVSFHNFFNSLSDEQKQKVSNELRKNYMPVPAALNPAELHVHTEPKPLLGVTYSPEGANEPYCEFSKIDAIRDIASLAPVTLKIRTYGTQCHQAEYILYAIGALKLDTSLAMGVWISSDEGENQRQISEAKHVLLGASSGVIESVLIGHEAIQRTDVSETRLVSYIREMRSFLAAHSISIPVGTSESPSVVSQTLVDSCDVLGFTLQPFLAGIPSDQAAQWTLDRYLYLVRQFSNGRTTFIIAEVGWPYNGGHFKKAEASPDNYRTFMRHWLQRESNLISSDWYVFEAFNEPWKLRFNTEPDSWEAEWGIFNNARELRLNTGISDDT